MEKVSEIPQERIAKKSIEPSSSFAGGDRGKESPFEISNAAELQHFANIFNDIQLAEGEDIFDWQQKYQKAYYVLTNDITVNTDAEMKEADTKAPTYNWQPIGKFSDDKNQDRMYFQGSFDGREHYVSGLYSCVLGEVTGADVYLGLFADATKSTISNVTVKNSYFYVYNSTGGAAALAGRLYESSIENCHVENVKVYAHSGSVAGIVGHPISTNTIVGCTASRQIKSGYASYVAGLTAILQIQPPKLIVFIVIGLCRYLPKQDFPNQPKRHKCYFKKVFISNKTNLNIMYNINNTTVLNINRLAFYSKLCLIIASTFSFLTPR